MPRLIITSPGFEGQSCELPDGDWSVGRGDRNQIVIRDPSVSHDHCDLLVYSSEVIVREHRSSNGTYVDGVRVNEQAGVLHGQCLRFGKIEARVEIAATVENDDSDVTAVYTYRDVMEKASRPPAREASFPVVFARPEDRTGESATLVIPKPPEPRKLSLGAASVRVGSGRSRWGWIVAGVVLAVAAALFWLRRR